MRIIELFEWDRGSTDASVLSRIEKRLLIRFNESIKKQNGSDAITINYQEKFVTYSYVGIIQIGKKRIEILPKLVSESNYNNRNSADQAIIRTARRNLLSILSYCSVIPLHKSAQSQYDHQKDFFEFIISIFLDDLEKALIAQLHHEYIPHDDGIPYLRGRVNLVKEMVKSPTKKHLFFCVFDEFTADNLFNRIIKASLKRIRELSKYENNRKRADTLCMMMDEVSDSIITHQSFSQVKITRLNENYKGIIQFCKLILLGETLCSELGMENFYALIFDMNLVFERYITRLLRNTFPEEYQFHYQEQLFLASDVNAKNEGRRNRRELYPDILVKDNKERNQQNIAVIDTKYKLSLARDRSISNSDIYQMIAYCIASDSNKAILIYPSLPQQEVVIEKDYWIFLDNKNPSLIEPKIIQNLSKRTLHISAISVQILSREKTRILHKLTDEDKERIGQFLGGV